MWGVVPSRTEHLLTTSKHSILLTILLCFVVEFKGFRPQLSQKLRHITYLSYLLTYHSSLTCLYQKNQFETMSLFKGCNDTARAYLTISVESAVHNNPNTLSPGQTTASPYLTSCWQGSVTKCLQNCLQSILRGRNTSPCGGQRGWWIQPRGAPRPPLCFRTKLESSGTTWVAGRWQIASLSCKTSLQRQRLWVSSYIKRFDTASSRY